MKILADVFPEGKKAALTMSYDDGRDYDKRLVEIFNKDGIKGTFHLNSSRMTKPGNGCVTLEEIPEVYKGHEVSCHTLTQPFPEIVPETVLVNEILEDRRTLEKACGYTVRGMSYPYGNFSERDIKIYTSCGMRYSRTTISTNGFGLPENFMKWNPTCHHKGKLTELFDALVARTGRYLCHDVMYVWGHSYEFENDNNWDVIEKFCSYAGGHGDIWYATNIEIYDYIMASRALMVGVDGKTVYNPSCTPVWVRADGEVVKILPGENTL